MTIYKTGKRKYYKYAFEDWTQPVATAATTAVDGGNMVVTSSSTYDSSYQNYYAFNNSTSNWWASGANVSSAWLKIVFPYKIRVKGLTLYNGGDNFRVANARFYTGSDLTIPIGDAFTGINSKLAQTVVSGIPTEGVITDTIYLNMTSRYGSGYAVASIKIEADKQVPIEVTAADDHDYSVLDTDKIKDVYRGGKRIVAAYKGSQLVYNLKYDLITTANWQSVGTISGHNFFGSGTFSSYISATREGTVTFNRSLPSGKYTWRFTYSSQVNHTFSVYRITVTYEDGTTETLYNSSLGDTAYGGGETATIDLALTFKKPVKAITNYTSGSGGGKGCYGGSGNVQLFFDGTKQ